MRSFVFGLAVAVMAAALSPVAANAAMGAPDTSASKPEKATKGAKPTDDAKKHQQGMAEAPPLIQQTGINCTLTDATYVGQGKTTKDGPGQKIYEVVCQEGLGYMILSPAPGTPNAFDCLGMSSLKPKEGQPDTGQVYCRLPANAEPEKAVAAIAAKAGVSCPVTQAHYVGTSADGKLDQYEVACADGTANIVQNPRVGSTQKLMSANCLLLNPGTCATYLPKDKMLAQLASIAAPAKRECQVSDSRYMATVTSNNNSYFEVACSGDKPGYVLQVDAGYKYVAAIECARATSIAGGCNLTSASAAQTEANATYTKLAQQIGYPCNVKSYHSFGLDQKSGREVVELACSDHEDGAIAMVPVDTGQKGEYFNCVRAAAKGLKCALTPAQATYAKMSSQISSQGKTCQVSNAQALGVLPTGEDVVEVVCSAGSGFMVEYAAGADQIKTVTACAAAKGIGGGCKLTK